MKNGFITTIGKYVYFYETDKVNKCKEVIDAFIYGLCKHKNKSNELRDRILADEPTRKQLAYDISKATYELRTTDNGYQYHHIEGKSFIMNFPLEDCDEIVFIN